MNECDQCNQWEYECDHQCDECDECDQCKDEWWSRRKTKPVEKVSDYSRSEPWVKVNSNPCGEYDDHDHDYDHDDEDDDDHDEDEVKRNPDKIKLVRTTIINSNVTNIDDFDIFLIQ